MTNPAITPFADWSALDPAARLAREAATAAYAIGADIETGDPIVFRANDYSDVQAAVAAAVDASRYSGIDYFTVPVPAHYSIRGAHLDADPEEAKALFEQHVTGSGLTTVVITLAADYPVDDLTMIPVLSQIGREARDAADAVFAYIGTTIVIVMEPKAPTE